MTEPGKNVPPPPMPGENPRQRKTGKKALRVVILCLFFGICAYVILFPKLLELITEPSRGASKGNLGSIRSALSIYYGDMKGVYPSTLESLTVGGEHLRSIPPAKTPPYHQDSSAATFGKVPDDTGGWLYNNDARDANFGTVLVNCTHTDSRGSTWAAY